MEFAQNRSMRHVLLLALFCVLNARAQPVTNAVDPAAAEKLAKFGKRGVRVHDPSTIVRDKDEYWLFFTGRGIPSYRSKDLLTWTNGPRVFTNSVPWVQEAVPNNRGGLDFWAPDAIKVNGRFLVYFSASTFGKNTSAIGLASNKTLDPDSPDYLWKDEGIVVQSASTNNFNTIDPSVTLDQAGGLWLCFGSFWSGIKLIELDSSTGKRIRADSPMYSLARNESIEAPFIYFHDGFYYLFVNWGRCCRGANSTYNMRIGRAQKITGPYLDKDGKDMADGGGSLLLESDGPFIGPGHAGILKEGERYWMSMHYYDATQHGMSTLAIRPLIWGNDGWPVVKEND
jgi:arabinan endo-1,5-alpha-L-arabinosidase